MSWRRDIAPATSIYEPDVGRLAHMQNGTIRLLMFASWSAMTPIRMLHAQGLFLGPALTEATITPGAVVIAPVLLNQDSVVETMQLLYPPTLFRQRKAVELVMS